MAINKKLIHFKNKQKFNEELANGNILETSIVFILETTEIYTHGQLYDGSTFDPSDLEDAIETKLDKEEAAATYLPKGNYVVDDGVSDGVYAVTADGKLIDYNSADTTALGVALVAGDHLFMIAKTDAADGPNTTFYWTNNMSDLSLTNYNKADGTNDFGYLPKPGGAFGGSTHLSDDFITWTAGALSDFNGRANTTVIEAASSNAQDMCTVLKTFNQTEQTADRSADWYVPACGQLALMYLAKTDINAALAKIGGTAFESDYWSSSEGGTDLAWYVDFNNSFVNNNTKSNFSRVRFVRDISVPSLKERVSELESKVNCIKFTNKTANAWIEDPTYSDFKYKCDIACEGVTADMYAEVVFNVDQAVSGNYAPVCETKSNVVSVWSFENATITIPTIIITK